MNPLSDPHDELHLKRGDIVPLIEKYHEATREIRAFWHAQREGLSLHLREGLEELLPMWRQADASTRVIAGERLTRLTDGIAESLRRNNRPPLVEVFGWSHFQEMDLYGDDPESRASVRSFGQIIEQALRPSITREEARRVLTQLFGSSVRHIGPGVTGLFYFLHPSLYPVLDRRGIQGFNRLFSQPQRPGREGLKHLADNLAVIWRFVDRYADVLDPGDLIDVSGFLRWLGAAPEPSLFVIREPETPYHPDTFPDTPLSLTPENLKKGVSEITRTLAVDPAAVEQIVVNLIMGKSVILTGAPGTGKTELARMIPAVFWNRYPMIVTATSDWTAHEVIGGLYPSIGRDETGDRLQLAFRRGYVYEAVMLNWSETAENSPGSPLLRKRYPEPSSNHVYDGVWLIIDEFNRADIDRAFGTLFTALETGMLRAPRLRADEAEPISEEIPLPADFRLIGTINTFDRHHLYEMSDGLKRRFAFIHIMPHPDRRIEEQVVRKRTLSALKQRGVSPDASAFDALFQSVFEWISFVRLFRMIGTAQLMAALTYAGLRLAYQADAQDAIEEGVRSHIVDQLDGLGPEALLAIIRFTRGEKDDLFSLFEQMDSRRSSFRHLNRFARYLAKTGGGAARLTAERLAALTERDDETAQEEIDLIFQGDGKAPGWRDMFSSSIRGPVWPTVAAALQELADERL